MSLLLRLMVTMAVNHFPQICEHCGHCFSDEPVPDPQPVVHHATDIPFAPPGVVEHRGHRRGCPTCGKTTLAKLANNVPSGAFGVGAQAAVAYYTGARRCSRRETARIFHDLHGIDMSVETVKAIEENVAEALAPCYEEATGAISKSLVVHQDETGWREGGDKAWPWLAAMPFG